MSNEILADGPVGYWPLRGHTNDASGNGNDLTIHTAGGFAQGYYWPIGDSGSRGDQLWDTGVAFGAGDWTLEFRIDRYDLGAYVSFCDDIATGAGGRWAGTGIEWANGAGYTYIAPDVSAGYFSHFAAVNSGGTLTVYHGRHYNGGPATIEHTWTLTGQTGVGNLILGGGHAFYAEVAFFNYALSEARIEAHFTGFSPSTEVEPSGGDAVDPYAVDGSIFTSTPIYGYSWSGSLSGTGTEGITSNVFTTDYNGFKSWVALDDGVDQLAPPNALSMDVVLPAGFDGLDTVVALGWMDLNSGTQPVVGAFIRNGALYIGSAIAGSTESWASSPPIDVTAGTHTITIKYANELFEAWWDGVYATNVADGSLYPVFVDAWTYRQYDLAVGFGVFDNDTNESFSFSPMLFIVGSGEYGDLEAPDLDGGLVRMTGVDNNLYVGGLEAPELVGGVQAPINSDLLVDVHVGGLESVPLTGGLAFSYSPTTFPPNLPITTPGYQYGTPSAIIEVGGYDHRLSASFSAAMNSASSGNFDTLPPGPTEGDEITVTVGGRAVLTGYAETSDHEVAPGEESEQTVSVSLTDILEVDWTESIVWPDIAASEPIRLGRPPQPDRTWDWHSNAGMYDRLELVSSVGGDNAIYGTANENHPFPDNWPDPYSKWMWDRNPDQDNIPAGWVYFRVPFGLLFAKEVGIFLCAWDYATLSIDGQQFIEADQPGATFRHDLHLDWDYHLVTIAAYTAGGKAGVNCSIMPKEKHGFTPSVMNSRGGWEVLSYPEKPLRFTVGKVLERLVIEAQDRGAPAGNWTLEFDKNQDSAGNPWPTDDSLITTSVGMTYWDVLNQLAEDRIDFRASPTGRKLYAYVKGEPPRTVGSPWAAGATLSDRYEDRAVR